MPQKTKAKHYSLTPPHQRRGAATLLNLSSLRTNLSVRPQYSGGAGRDRTDDPRLAKPMLSQLSYSPRVCMRAQSDQWWVWLGSNQRPPPYQDGALTS